MDTFPKVELHIHLEGAIRPSTAYELIKNKNLPLPGNGSYEDFLASFVLKRPASLQTYLHRFSIFCPGILGDLEAVERVSYEFCQTKAEQGVIYAEARLGPHSFIPGGSRLTDPNFGKTLAVGESTITPDDVLKAINRGFDRGEQEFGIVVRIVLTCVRGRPELSREMMDLCVKFKDNGRTVGLDLCGDGGDGENESGTTEGEQRIELWRLDEGSVKVFEEAALLGIHRTAHAGECKQPPEMVLKAIEEFKAERIGHGYRVLEDEAIYRHCLATQVHFEVCPTSSILTGSIAHDDLGLMKNQHPVIRFAQDGASYSISTDDPTISGKTMENEYDLLSTWGLTIDQIKQSNIEGMKRSFAEPHVKETILQKLMVAYGMST